MKTIFYLSTCDTCKKIMGQINTQEFELRDIKTNPITAKQLDDLAKLAGSYEALFSRRAKLYQERGLKNENLSEADYKLLLLEHYTFLQRPVVVFGNDIWIGSSAKTLNDLKQRFNP